MYRKIVFLVVICLLSSDLWAQIQNTSLPVLSNVAEPDSIPKVFGRWYLPHYQSSATIADTSGALLSLFVRKRTTALWYVLGLPVGASALQPNETSINGVVTKRSAPEGWRIAIGVPLVAVSMGGYIARLVTYSKSSLQQIQKQYESGKPIPVRLRRKLKPIYFSNAAILRVAIVQQLHMEKLREQQQKLRK